MEDDHPDREEEGEEELEKEELQTISDEGESPVTEYEDGSGFFEGSANTYIADQSFVTAASETGSGEADVDYEGNFNYYICYIYLEFFCSIQCDPSLFFCLQFWLMRQNLKRRS